jgi:hypothetical protein
LVPVAGFHAQQTVESREDRIAIAAALGAKNDLAEDVAPVGVGDDPDYAHGGKDTIV